MSTHQKLPQRKSEVWLGSRRTVDIPVQDVAAVDVMIWVEKKTGVIRAAEMVPSDCELSAFPASLARAMESPLVGKPARPGRVLVDRPGLLEAIEPVAREAGFKAELRPSLAELDTLVAALEEDMGQGPGFSYLDEGDVTSEEVEAFVTAAIAYLDIEPWTYAEDYELLRVEGLEPTPVLCSVLGAAGIERGLAIYLTPEAADLYLSGQVPERIDEAPALGVTLLAPEEVPPGLEAEIFQWGWPVHPDGFPLLLRSDRPERSAPTSSELALARKVLEALTAFLAADPMEAVWGPSTVKLSSGETVEVEWAVEDEDEWEEDEDVRSLVEEALNEPDLARRRDLVNQALALEPDNFYALLLAAQLAPPEERLSKLLEAEELGHRTLPHLGMLSDVVEHPFVEVVHAVMDALWEAGRHEEAIERADFLLDLTEDEDLFARDRLAHYLFTLERYQDLEELWQDFQEERSPGWLFTGALCEFRWQGPTKRFKRRLAKALNSSPRLAEYLLDRPGSEAAAIYYDREWKRHWERTPGALEALKKRVG